MLRNNWINLMRILWIICTIGMRNIIEMVLLMALSWLWGVLNSKEFNGSAKWIN